jgi:hypothetical protein
MRNEKTTMKNARYCTVFGIIIGFVLLFTTCQGPFSASENNPIANGYGRVNIITEGGEARTVMPTMAFDKYVYTFTKAGGAAAIVNPDNGFFKLEAGNYTVEVKAYIGNAEPYTLAASGVSNQFTVNSGSTVTIRVPLQEVSGGQGEFTYTITYPTGADAAITLKKWPGLTNIALSPSIQGNVKTQTLTLDSGSYMLSITVSINGLSAGISEAVHIYPSQTTVYAKDLTTDFGATIFVSNTNEWNAALNLIKNGGSGTTANPKAYTIFVNGDVAVPGSTVNSFGTVTNVQVTLNATGTKKLYLTSKGSLLTIGSNQTVVIDSAGLTLQGLKAGQNGSSQDNDYMPVIYVESSSGKLVLKNGTITGNTSSSSYSGGGGVLVNGTFIMSGGVISSNTVNRWGGGVYVDGTFTMTGGEISGNISSYSGGGVDVRGTFTISGGKISGNTASGGGGVSVTSGTFTMNGGEISGNTASTGGGVDVEGTFTMSGGNISGNTASSGGGVSVSFDFMAVPGGSVTKSGTFTMSGGEIFGNTVSSSGGGVYVSSNIVTFIKNGGTIYGYTSGDTRSNVVKNNSGVVQSNKGHAVYVITIPYKRRETTAGPTVNLNSSVDGSSGGWE